METEEEYLDALTAQVYCMAEDMAPEDFQEEKPDDAQGIAGDISILEMYGGGFLLTALDHIMARLDWTEKKLSSWETGESLTKEEALRAMEDAWKAEAKKTGRPLHEPEPKKVYFATIENNETGYCNEEKTDCASAAVFGDKYGPRDAGDVVTVKTPSGRLVSTAKWSERSGKYEYC